jgi:DNA processing protein
MAISSSCEYIAHLSSVKGLGLKTFYHLYNYYGDIENLAKADYESLIASGLKPMMARSLCSLHNDLLLNKSVNSIEKQLEWSDQEDQRLLCVEDADYPPMLKEVYCPPPLIYIKGCVGSLSLPSLAVVGSRKPSIAGKQHAFSFSRDLSFQGFNIVSGLALGVDTQAHKGALEASGITCAVLGTGLDIIYPRQNRKLAEQIIERGALISEMALGSMPVPANFPRRNRLISGLSQGSLIVEAGLKSGSLITANYAVEQNRDVYVIPGPIDSEVSAGCNELIKQGAQLVTCVEDILGVPTVEESRKRSFTIESEKVERKDENKGGNKGRQEAAQAQAREKIQDLDLNSEETKLLTLLGFQCTSFDLLAGESGFDAGIVIQTLVSLELKGLISSVPGGYQRVK